MAVKNEKDNVRGEREGMGGGLIKELSFVILPSERVTTKVIFYLLSFSLWKRPLFLFYFSFFRHRRSRRCSFARRTRRGLLLGAEELEKVEFFWSFTYLRVSSLLVPCCCRFSITGRTLTECWFAMVVRGRVMKASMRWFGTSRTLPVASRLHWSKNREPALISSSFPLFRLSLPPSSCFLREKDWIFNILEGWGQRQFIEQ